MNAVIETQELTKHYGPVIAVDGLTLTLTAGEVFGVLGPNGSGKTTTILMLLGLTEPTSGTVRVLGFDPSRNPLEVKRRVGYLPDSVGFYDDLTAGENMRYIGRLNGLARPETESRINEVLARMGLTAVADRRVGAFSRGMRQRLGLADVLLKRPAIAILDEPTAGLDPEAAMEYLGMIKDLKAHGITVLLASHLLHQVQAVCDRVGLFSNGKMVLEGTFEALADRVLGGAYRITVETARPDGLESALRTVPGVTGLSQDRPGLFKLEAQADCRAEVARRVVGKGVELLGLTLERPSLDDIYARYFQVHREA
jgi:ABC-2 type transport system ATP-binding protein